MRVSWAQDREWVQENVPFCWTMRSRVVEKIRKNKVEVVRWKYLAAIFFCCSAQLSGEQATDSVPSIVPRLDSASCAPLVVAHYLHGAVEIAPSLPLSNVFCCFDAFTRIAHCLSDRIWTPLTADYALIGAREFKAIQKGIRCHGAIARQLRTTKKVAAAPAPILLPQLPYAQDVSHPAMKSRF